MRVASETSRTTYASKGGVEHGLPQSKDAPHCSYSALLYPKSFHAGKLVGISSLVHYRTDNLIVTGPSLTALFKSSLGAPAMAPGSEKGKPRESMETLPGLSRVRRHRE